MPLEYWDINAPLPSIQTREGRERFLQTPAFVIAAHYNRSEPVSMKQRMAGMKEQLKVAAQQQAALLAEKEELQDELHSTRINVSRLQEDNKELRYQNGVLSSQLAAMHRSNGDAHQPAAEQGQVHRPGGSSASQRDVEAQLHAALAEVERLRAKLKAAGITA